MSQLWGKIVDLGGDLPWNKPRAEATFAKSTASECVQGFCHNFTTPWRPYLFEATILHPKKKLTRNLNKNPDVQHKKFLSKFI